LEMQLEVTNVEMPKYKKQMDRFGKELAISACEVNNEKYDPANWWGTFGGATPNLKNVAMRILSLTSSSSGCERNWSTFEGFDHLKMEMEMEIPSSSNVKLITECSDTTYTCYEVMKDLIKVSKLPQTLQRILSWPRIGFVDRLGNTEQDLGSLSAIAISSDSSDCELWVPALWVILFGDLPTIYSSSSVVISKDFTIAAYIIQSALLWLRRLLLASRHASPRSLDHHSSSSSSSSDSSGLSSSGDSSERPLHSSSHSAGPSHKRCRSPVDFVPSSTSVIGSLAPTHADLLPPRKRFRDSYSYEASIEDDTEIDPIETEVDMKLGIGDRDDVRNHVKIDPRDVRYDTEEYEADTSAGDTVEVEDSSDSSGTRDGIVRSFEDMPIDLDDDVRDFYHHMSEVRIDRIVKVREPQGPCYVGYREGSCEQSLSSHVSFIGGVSSEVLAAHEVTRAANALETENQSQNGSDGDNGNGGNGNGRDENPDGNGKGDRPAARECTYQDFMKCQPLNFKGTEGVVGLISWFEKMEIVFHISNCLEKSQVKYATCTLLDSALTWWNSHKRTIWTEAAFSMSWSELMKLMTEVYCLRNEIQKMETEL
ncbi:putative reverse transcriptase domain-containing protein, partial [Tanacetum coccineum]